MFFTAPSPTPTPGPGPLPSGNLSLDTDLILLLVAVVVIAWALGQLSLIIFKSIRTARRQAARRRQNKLDEDDYSDSSGS